MPLDPVDYIIVGAGTAGCVLADRLSASGRNRVLLLEAGGSDRRFWIRVPIGYGRTFNNPAVNWMYEAEPEAALGGVASFWPRGKVMGGSGSINAMVYARGQPGDFDDWRALGNPGWAWSEVLPHFQAIEQRGGGKLACGVESLWPNSLSHHRVPDSLSATFFLSTSHCDRRQRCADCDFGRVDYLPLYEKLADRRQLRSCFPHAALGTGVDAGS